MFWQFYFDTENYCVFAEIYNPLYTTAGNPLLLILLLFIIIYFYNFNSLVLKTQLFGQFQHPQQIHTMEFFLEYRMRKALLQNIYKNIHIVCVNNFVSFYYKTAPYFIMESHLATLLLSSPNLQPRPLLMFQ